MYRSLNLVPKVNVSDVAGLIGRHPYKPQTEVFERIAIENGYVDYTVDTTDKEVECILKKEINDVLASTTACDVEETMTNFERKAEALIVEDIVKRVMYDTSVLKTPIGNTNVIEAIVLETCTKDKTIEENIETCLRNTLIQKELAGSKDVKQIKTIINKVRGTALENESTNKLEKIVNRSVDFRNAKCYTYNTGVCVLAGRIDGMTDDAIVETKTRRRFWKAPPDYDIIQLRCYMKLCNKPRGILNESFPNGSVRVTTIDWDEKKWEELETDITNAIATFMETYC